MDRITRLQAQPSRRVSYGNAPAPPGSRRNPIHVHDAPSTRATTRSTPAPQPRATTRKAPVNVNSGGIIKPGNASKLVVKVAPKKKEPKPKRECIICASTKSVSSYTLDKNKEACEHFKNICHRCIRRLVSSKIDNRRLTEPGLACTYSGCDHMLDHKTMKSALRKSAFDAYDDALTRHHLDANTHFISCLSADCGKHFSIEDCSASSSELTKESEKSTKSAQTRTKSTKSANPTEPATKSTTKSSKSTEAIKSTTKPLGKHKIECPYCDYALCLTCNRPWHTLTTCSLVSAAEDAASVAKIRSMGAKPCPKCGINIEKRGGCDHMTCNRCRHNFCWICLVPFDRQTPHLANCPHARPTVMNELANWDPEDATAEQMNHLLEHARRRTDDETGRREGGHNQRGGAHAQGPPPVPAPDMPGIQPVPAPPQLQHQPLLVRFQRPPGFVVPAFINDFFGWANGNGNGNGNGNPRG